MGKSKRQRTGGSRGASWLFLAGLLLASPVRAQAPVVTSADPAVTVQGTSLDVTINGSGFERGARSTFYVTGTSDPGGVTVNSTTYKSSSKLLANLTVAPNAAASKFDVAVELRDGRRGVGMERFLVKVPPGTVYYLQSVGYPGYCTDCPPSGTYRMDAGGNGKTLLAVGGYAPSLLLHGGKRWFFGSQFQYGLPSYYDPNGRNDLYAYREDGVSVQLTASPDLAFYAPSQIQWAPDETASSVTICVPAQLWNSSGTQVYGSTGLYVATLRFDAAGNPIGLDAPPAFRVSLGIVTGVDPNTGVKWEHPDIKAPISWAPDMTRLAADRRSDSPAGNELRIISVATGVSTTLLRDSTRTLGQPTWSPSGSLIAFQSSGSSCGDLVIELISPAGAGRRTLVPKPKCLQSVSSPKWSPDSAYLAYDFSWVKGNDIDTRQYDVYRISVSGSGNTNLTADTSGWALSRGWR